MDEYLEGIMNKAKPIIVACRCGWEGDQRDLVSYKHQDEKYCPACAQAFKKWPSAPPRS